LAAAPGPRASQRRHHLKWPGIRWRLIDASARVPALCDSAKSVARSKVGNINGTPELIERDVAATHLCQRELIHISEKYGSIYGPGRNWLPYHNATHAEQGHDAAYAIATQLVNQGRLDALDLPLVKIAGTFHDHEQDLGPGNNERASADAAAQEMKEYPSLFSDDDIQKVMRMIEGTEVSIDADRTMHQAAAHDDSLQAILADADLSTLGLRSYALMATHLLLEIQAKSGRITLPDSVEGIARDSSRTQGRCPVPTKARPASHKPSLLPRCEHRLVCQRAGAKYRRREVTSR
jgi:hypothetical protein